MKTSILALILILFDGALYWALGRLERERGALERRREELSLRAEAHRETGERSSRVAALLERASHSIPASSRAIDIADLRDLLLSAERGLDLDRFSLEFRPSQDAPEGREGGRVSANLVGSFDGVNDYLARVEEKRLPLAVESVSLRRDESGRIVLAIEWNGLWSGGGAALDELSASEVARLESWLEREPAPRPGRDLFSGRDAGPGPSPPFTAAPLPADGPATEEPAAAPLEASTSTPAPRLTGFVIARPELETEVGRRVLAALRFEGELRLLGVGDAIGIYRVEAIEARESVLLVNQESGERLKLFLE